LRLDQAVAAHCAISRSKAADLIRNGGVQIAGRPITRPGRNLLESEAFEVTTPDRFVSRGAHKLLGFLKRAEIAVKGRTCLDVGSSTGGFVQVLFKKGAASVTAVDVGSAQLHESLRHEPRLQLYEQTDIRHFKSDRRFELITCDVSFVSLLHLLPALDALAKGVLVLLFKPQFEVGAAVKRNRAGVVQDGDAIDKARARFEAEAKVLGWRLLSTQPSEVAGRSGNQEFFYGFEKCTAV
jgi:23S rRNA (cytidine1920-2'-O)/16S rRNA (cytidine1409-2'-O)-methyltransferase